ncbi:MAG: DUF3179 domain-containing (seleno)protein, partial [Acidobacteriota bacterium]
AMGKDGVKVLSKPTTMTPAEVDRFNDQQRGKFLVPGDRVIGLTIGDEVRAYPLRLMRWHEVVNDVVGGVPIAITYSPLCDSVVVFDRGVGGEVVELGVSGYLYNSNTLLYDRRLSPDVSPLWLQLDGTVVAEGTEGTSSPLTFRLESLTTWGEWRDRHPETRVLSPVPTLYRLYKRDPYHSYFGSDLLHFPVRPRPRPGRLHLKDRVVIVTVDGRHEAFALRDLAVAAGARRGAVEVDSRGLLLRISFDVAAGTAIVEALAEPHRLAATRHSFWFAWYASQGMIPDTETIRDSGHPE